MKIDQIDIGEDGLRLHIKDEHGKPLTLHYPGEVATRLSTGPVVWVEISVSPRSSDLASKRSNFRFDTR